MEKLIDLNQNKEMVLDSREVAEMLGKEHWMILRDIEGNEKVIGIIPVLRNNNLVVSDYFIKSNYKSKGNNKTYPCYLITKMGCEMLGNKQQGEKGILFTAKYVKRFNEMEQGLKPKLPTTYKEALLALVAAEEEKEKLQLESEHKQEVINGLTDSVPVTTKKDIINRVVKWKKANYRQRYNEMYKSFREIHHVDLKARCEGYNMKQNKKKDELSIIKYADKMGYTNNLYNIACKLYESDVNEIKEYLGILL